MMLFRLLAHSIFDYKFVFESDSDSDAYFTIAPPETSVKPEDPACE